MYIRKEPEICLKQIQLRGRNEEKNIDFNYLKMLYDCHEYWLNNDETYNKIDINIYCKINNNGNKIICEGDYDVRNKDVVNKIFREIMKII